ncbi:DUF5658 family protein [Falsibacillus albus]|uniref:DUF5658 domain-containing protein n=1 Tax=Falsibacillus albus TaxID=2478915 RepID=A0A3L7JVI8_9BACI|nr:DUF5658 family protein [Falsibacillus albus]RLQ94888.1 hypothetical protein D9X91_12970 [Falsibacillus albus]
MQVNKEKSRRNLILATFLLWILTTIDAILTDFGIRHHYIHEANPLMNVLYNSSITSFYIIKMALPILLLALLTKVQAKPYIRVLTFLSLFLYVFVMIQHFAWLAHVISENR